MDILHKYTSKILLFCDFRTGSIKDKLGGIATIQNGTILDNEGLVFNGSARFNLDSINIGTSDFTVLAKVKASKNQTMGLLGYNASNFPLFYTTSQIRSYISGTTFSSGTHSQNFLQNKKTVGYTADRDGSMTFYEDGLNIGSVDFSSKVAVDINYAMALGSFYAAGNNTPFHGDFYYFLIIKDLLSETEIAQLTAQLESTQDKRVFSKAYNFVTVDGKTYPVGSSKIINGDFAAWTDPTVPDGWAQVGTHNAFNYVEESSEKCRLVSDGTGVGIRQSVFIVGKKYSLEYDVTDVTAGEAKLELSSVSFTIDSEGHFEHVFIADFTSFCIFYRINACDITIDNVFIKEVNEPVVFFKGEMHALANERTISSGQLENTPFEISSGSFKLITENVNGYECRVIECVTNGSLYLRTNYSSTTGWNRFVNTGSGYAETSAALGTANTFPLTSGDKIVYASKDPKQSLYNKA